MLLFTVPKDMVKKSFQIDEYSFFNFHECKMLKNQPFAHFTKIPLGG